jgi:glutamine amidotransferase
MMNIVVVDLGICNLNSVRRAVEHLGHQCDVITKGPVPDNTKMLILPGVGAFGAASKKLQETGLWREIQQAADRKVGILGICLGMQLLMTKSYEFGNHAGLDLISGEVKKISINADNKHARLRVPNVGWRKTILSPDLVNNREKYALLHENYFYHVHSYHVEANNKYVLGFSHFGNQKLISMVQKDNVWGCQFHPEKSGAAGLMLMERIIEDLGMAHG